MFAHPLTQEDHDKVKAAILAVPEGTPIEEAHEHLPGDVQNLLVRFYLEVTISSQAA